MWRDHPLVIWPEHIIRSLLYLLTLSNHNNTWLSGIFNLLNLLLHSLLMSLLIQYWCIPLYFSPFYHFLCLTNPLPHNMLTWPPVTSTILHDCWWPCLLSVTIPPLIFAFLAFPVQHWATATCGTDYWAMWLPTQHVQASAIAHVQHSPLLVPLPVVPLAWYHV